MRFIGFRLRIVAVGLIELVYVCVGPCVLNLTANFCFVSLGLFGSLAPLPISPARPPPPESRPFLPVLPLSSLSFFYFARVPSQSCGHGVGRISIDQSLCPSIHLAECLLRPGARESDTTLYHLTDFAATVESSFTEEGD